MTTKTVTDGCFRTLTRIKFSLTDPKPYMIHIDDIAAGLANKGHYSGQTPEYFSIAEHCLLTEWLCAMDTTTGSDMELRLISLLHDASEAYIGDIIRPLKDLVPEFKTIENEIHKAIFQKFDLPIERLSEVKKYDIEAQDLEAEAFYQERAHIAIRFLSPRRSKEEFIHRFFWLIEQRATL